MRPADTYLDVFATFRELEDRIIAHGDEPSLFADGREGTRVKLARMTIADTERAIRAFQNFLERPFGWDTFPAHASLADGLLGRLRSPGLNSAKTPA